MNKQQPNFTLKDFANLDSSDHADFLINSMEAHYRQPSMQKIKADAINLLELQANDQVLELGCGLGLDAQHMAKLLGPTGQVTALDNSERMLAEAKKRSSDPRIHFVKGDVNQLPFDDNSFSVCRADRLLVNQDNPSKVLAEALRILRNNGRLSITALDFGSLTLYPTHADMNKKIVQYWQGLVRNPFIGRSLLSLFKQHLLNQVVYQAHVFSVTSYQELKQIVPFENMLLDMLSKNIITQDELNTTKDALLFADTNGEFFWSINLITAQGNKA